MSTTNPAYASCPVGVAVFFPWMTEPPNSDWIVCDGKKYLKGDYPQTDALRETQTTNYRIDHMVYPNSVKQAESDDLILESSATIDKGTLYYIFLPQEYKEVAGGWASAVNPTLSSEPVWVNVTLKNDVTRLFTGVELTAQKRSYAGGFPKTFRFFGYASGEQWPLTSEISLSASPDDGEILYIPFEDLDTRANRLRMEIYETFAQGTTGYGTGLGRMRIYAKEDRTFQSPVLGENLSDQKGIWCLRVADSSNAG